MAARYASTHASPQGPGDARPTALQIIQDEDLIGKLADKVILITGCTSGIGVESAKALYATGARVFITARGNSQENIDTAQATAKEIENAHADVKNPHCVEVLHVELDSLDSVRRGAEDFLKRSDRLDILICNAGIMAAPFTTTSDGFESQFATNHLGHFLLFQLLKPTLVASSTPSSPSRVVVLTSGAHAITPPLLNDYNFSQTPYGPWLSYGQSKCANIWMANEIDRRYGSKGIHATSVNPGLIWSGLQKYVDEETKKGWGEKEDWKYLWKSTAQGAATTVWAAVAGVWTDQGGVVLNDCQVWRARRDVGEEGCADHAFDEVGEGVLWKDSCGMVGAEDDA
ncbi:hypothetical protein TWF281_008136 [Arthrobotrys megalospora]